MSYISDLIWRTNPLLRRLSNGYSMPRPLQYRNQREYIQMVADYRRGKKDLCSYDHLRACGWSENDIKILKEIEENRMCTSENKAGPVTPSLGSKWEIQGDNYYVRGTGLKYLAGNNADPGASYISLALMTNSELIGPATNIITHKRFAQLATPWKEPIKEVLVTADQLMRAGPCEGGVRALCKVLGIKDYGDSFYSMVKSLTRSGKLDGERSVQYFYTAYEHAFNEEPGNTYLLFVAKALDLVPKTSNGPDRATLKRLLGIK